jgi:hypothetical protein
MAAVWTPSLKKLAAKDLLARANSYEVKQRKSLRGIIYRNDGSARWIGDAHDYTVWIDDLKKDNGINGTKKKRNMASDIFTRAKEYRAKHPRTPWQDCVKKVAGKKVSGAKKTKAKAKTAKPASKVVSVRVSGVKKRKAATPGRKVVSVRVSGVKKSQTPMQRAQKIINNIDRLEAKRAAQPNKQMKDVVQLIINAEHKKLNSLMSTLKKQA